MKLFSNNVLGREKSDRSLKTRLLFVGLFLALVAGLFATAIQPTQAQSSQTVETLLNTTLVKEDVENFVALSQSDFTFSFVDRHTINVQPTNRNKNFYSSPGGSVSLGDIFPEGGVNVVDDSTNGDLIFKADEFGFRIDEFDDNGKLKDAMDNVEGDLGTVNLSDLTEFEFSWAMRYDDGFGLDKFFVTLENGWESRERDLVDDALGSGIFGKTGIRVTSFADKDNFNISIVPNITTQSGNLLSTGTPPVDFELCNANSSPPANPVTFSTRCLSTNDARKITFPAGVTLEDIRDETGFFDTKYDGSIDLRIYGGSNVNVDDSLFNSDAVGGVETTPSCESEGGSMSFIICPVLYGLDAAVDGIDGAITSLLYVDYDRYTSSNGLENSWKRMRNIAYIILIPVMLVMVIGTAIGVNSIDAYTVRRALPRLFAAVIFITLSWDICRIMIEISNGIGQGLAGLIGGAIREGGISQLQLRDVFTPSEGVATTAAIYATGGTVILASVLASSLAANILLAAAGYLLLLLLAAFLALGIALALLALRQMLIFALIILAPIAIISWIFPGNDKLWKLWWNSFRGLLLIFPIVIFFVTAGKGMAYIMFESGGASNLGVFSAIIDFTLKLVAYIGPYFFIPAAFKFAGGVFGNLAGMVNDRSKGIFDRNRRRRQQLKGYAGKQVTTRAKQGTLFRRGSTAGRNGWNDTARDATNLGKITGLRTIRDDLDAARRISAEGTVGAIHEDHDTGVWSGDDSLTGSQFDFSSGNTLGLARRIRDRSNDADGNPTITQAQAMADARSYMRAFQQDNDAGFENYLTNVEGKTAAEARIATAQIRQSRAKYDDHSFNEFLVEKTAAGGTYYTDDAMFLRAVGMATHGNDNARAGLVVRGRKAAGSGGALTQSLGSFGTTFTGAATAEAATTWAEMDRIARDHTNHVRENQSANVLLHSSAKQHVIDSTIQSMVDTTEELFVNYGNAAPGSQEQQEAEDILVRHMAELANTYDSASQANPVAARKFADRLLGVTMGQFDASRMDPGDGSPRTIMEQIELLRGDPEFKNMRREYQTNLTPQQAEAAAAQQTAAAAGQQQGGSPGTGPPGGGPPGGGPIGGGP